MRRAAATDGRSCPSRRRVSRSKLPTPTVETAGRLHTLATARVLLAHADAAEQKAVVATMGFEPAGPNAITDRKAFLRQLALTRKRGYALCLDESSEGCAAMAVPARDSQGAVVAALGIAVPRVRFAKRRRAQLLAELGSTVRGIAAVWRC